MEVINLRDMESYIGSRIRKITFNVREVYQATAIQRIPDADITASGKTLKWVQDALTEIQAEAQAIGLIVTAKGAERDLAEIKADTKCSVIRGRMEELERRICDELECVRFVQIPNARLEFLAGFSSFDDKVRQAFPGVKYEIDEAGNCLAIGCYTASVCHLMRGLEVCLKAFAVRLNAKFSVRGWQDAITEINKAISAYQPNTTQQSEDLKIFREYAKSFTDIKDEWRNYAMHGPTIYTSDSAKSAWHLTKKFMTKLADKIEEKTLEKEEIK